MKRYIQSTMNVVEAAEDDEAVATLEDKIDDAKSDFDYIIDGLNQLDTVQANEILNEMHDFLQKCISDIAGQLS